MPHFNASKRAASATVVPRPPSIKPVHENTRNSNNPTLFSPTTQTTSLLHMQDSVTSIHMESKELKLYRQSIKPRATVKMKSSPSIPFIHLKSDVDLEEENINYK